MLVEAEREPRLAESAQLTRVASLHFLGLAQRECGRPADALAAHRRACELMEPLVATACGGGARFSGASAKTLRGLSRRPLPLASLFASAVFRALSVFPQFFPRRRRINEAQ